MTTIRLNGPAGDRFLASLSRYRAPVPRALHWLASSGRVAIRVAPEDAELVSRFVDDLLATGWIQSDTPPLLFSPRVGESVVAHRDVLVETARHTPGAPIVWRLLEAGALGKLLGWRDRRGEEPRAVVELEADEGRRVVVFVRESNVTRAPRRRVTAL
jgi:hypothetical protein